MQALAELSQQQEKELSAREIFNKILKGQTVQIPNDPIAADQLKNHLNVIKSREKKLFLDLGLDFISSVISVTEIKSPNKYLYDPSIVKEIGSREIFRTPYPQEIQGTEVTIGYEVKLVAPKKRRTFTTFTVKENVPAT